MRALFVILVLHKWVWHFLSLWLFAPMNRRSNIDGLPLLHGLLLSSLQITYRLSLFNSRQWPLLYEPLRYTGLHFSFFKDPLFLGGSHDTIRVPSYLDSIQFLWRVCPIHASQDSDVSSLTPVFLSSTLMYINQLLQTVYTWHNICGLNIGHVIVVWDGCVQLCQFSDAYHAKLVSARPSAKELSTKLGIKE